LTGGIATYLIVRRGREDPEPSEPEPTDDIPATRDTVVEVEEDRDFEDGTDFDDFINDDVVFDQHTEPEPTIVFGLRRSRAMGRRRW